MGAERMFGALYSVGLRFLPAHFRRAHGAELRALVADRMKDARARGGFWALGAVLLRELLDVIQTALRLRRGQTGGRPRSAGPRRRFVPGDWLRELRLALRGFVQGPRHALAAVLTLGIGVAVGTAAFAVFDALVLRPLPHREPARLVQIWRTLPHISMPRAPTSYPTYQDWRQRLTLLEDLALYTGTAFTLTGGSEPERISGSSVSGNLFELLGNQAEQGRTLVPSDDDPFAEPVIVLSHALWQRQFAGQNIVGRTIPVNDRPYRVVGVMPADFNFPWDAAEFWIALRLDPAKQERDANFLNAIGRLRSGSTIAALQQQLEGVHRDLRARYPVEMENSGVQAEFRRDYVLGNAGRAVTIVLIAALAVLLTGCANLTNLLLVRGLTRGREFALRSALGAGRRALLSQAAAEALVLAATGTAIALGFSLVLQRLLVNYGTLVFPRPVSGQLDLRTIGFAALATLLCALFASILPALRATRVAPATALQSGGRTTTSRQTQFLQGALVCAQVAGAVVLLTGATLLTRSLLRLSAVPVGFERENVLTTRLSLTRNRYDSKEKISAFYDELFAALRALPGVQYAGGTLALPFSGDFASSSFLPAGSTTPPGEAPSIISLPVRGEYFNALGMRLLRGRMFAESDRAGATPVVIVNRALAQRFWPGEDAVGKQIVQPEHPKSPYTVVGVVNDVRRRELSDEVQPEIYFPHAQSIWDGTLYVALRFSGSGEALAAQLRREVWRIDPRLPVRAPVLLEEMIGNSIAAPRFRAYVFLVLAGSAAALALIGVYGLLAFMVTLRRRDIAIRLALGATPRAVLREVTRSGLRLMAIGLGAGIAIAFLLTGQLRTFLFRLDPHDPLTFALTALVVLLAGVLAALLPAARASRIEPLRSISS